MFVLSLVGAKEEFGNMATKFYFLVKSSLKNVETQILKDLNANFLFSQDKKLAKSFNSLYLLRCNSITLINHCQ